METISLKMENVLLQEIDTKIKSHRYSTRTEFIRDAIRDKLSDLEKEELMAKFLNFRGKAKHKTTYEENLKTKEAVGKELMAELDKRFN